MTPNSSLYLSHEASQQYTHSGLQGRRNQPEKEGGVYNKLCKKIKMSKNMDQKKV